jgi:hypothetical protein
MITGKMENMPKKYAKRYAKDMQNICRIYAKY